MKKYFYTLLFLCFACLPSMAQVCQTQGNIIHSVSIDMLGRPVITWFSSASLPGNANGYIIYNYLGNSFCTDIIDSVGLGVYSYTHVTAPLPLNMPRSYTVAVSTTTIPEPLTRQHTYCFLKAEYDSCRYGITLEWTAYEGWDGMVTYDVFGGKYGDIPVKLGGDISATTFHINNTPDNVLYEVYIVAVNSTDQTIQSCSNRVKVQTKTSQRPAMMHIHTVNYRDNIVSLQFDIDLLTQLSAFYLLRSTSSDGYYARIHSFTNKNLHSFIDNDISIQYYYRLMAENYCGVEAAHGNIVSNVMMAMEAQNGEWYIKWSPPVTQPNNMLFNTYTLKRLKPQPATLLNSSLNTSYIDAIDFTEPELTYCYSVEASGVNEKSISTICETYNPKIIMPNAIDPKSMEQNPLTGRLRNQFGPVVSAHPATYMYRLEIYSRNGAKIAVIEKKENDSPLDKSWRGVDNNGNFVEEGIYVYNLLLTYTDGATETRTGTVTLVYN